MTQWTNWSGSVTAAPGTRVAPADDAALREAVTQGPAPVRTAGSGHSFTPLCATPGTLLHMESFSGLQSFDGVSQQATAGAGTPLHALGQPLHNAGLALINQGDIDRQTLAGAVSTGTHGTGLGLGGFPSAVTGLELMSADGTLIACDGQKEPEIFEAARLSLGAIGVLTKISLQCRRSYKLKERLWMMPAEECLADLDRLSKASRHFEFWWFPYADDVVCKSLEETDERAPAPRGATGASAERDALEGGDDSGRRFMDMGRAFPFLAPMINRMITRAIGKSTEKGRTSVRWSFEAFPSPRNLAFNEMEYSVPVEVGPECLRTLVAEIRRKRIGVCFPIEYRYIAADSVWLSPFQGRDSVSISVHQYWKQSPKPLFDLAESVFRSVGGRPHWGKMHSLTAKDFEALYPHFNDFRRVRANLDPQGRFLNDHLRTVFGA